MIVAETIAEARAGVADARAGGKSVGLVPTMGALHQGHLSLIDASTEACGYTVVSIFVNPAQFGPDEDFDAYPRTRQRDLALCERRGADLVFAPPAGEMYPRRRLAAVRVCELEDRLCGRSRPGHFVGVCTVVAKLLNIVGPDRAYFGAKDYQQAVIIRRMVEDLNFPVEIVVRPTVREADGLAMSSRNRYLSKAQRECAPALREAMDLAAERIRESHPPAEDVIGAMRRRILARAPEARIEYTKIVDPETLADVEDTDRAVQIALAVRIGPARLIDNMRVDGGAGGT